MPIFLVALLLIAICVFLAVIYLIKTGKAVNLEKRWLNIAFFLLSLISLIISIKLFWNMGFFADEYGSSPALLSGGWFWLYMDWFRLALLLVLTVISGINLFLPPNKD